MSRADTPSCPRAPRVRLLIVPGLGDSGPGHWQTWLQGLHRHATRVSQHDWQQPELERWSARIASTIEHGGPGPWVAVAHSFGVLALAHHLAGAPDSSIAGALLVAPANPDRFGLVEALPRRALPALSSMVLSQNDPWMPLSVGLRWARHWGSHVVNLGEVGHINIDSGFGAFPFARRWVMAMEQRLVQQRRQAAGERADVDADGDDPDGLAA